MLDTVKTAKTAFEGQEQETDYSNFIVMGHPIIIVLGHDKASASPGELKLCREDELADVAPEDYEQFLRDYDHPEDHEYRRILLQLESDMRKDPNVCPAHINETMLRNALEFNKAILLDIEFVKEKLEAMTPETTSDQHLS